jgi:hypothetical protein
LFDYDNDGYQDVFIANGNAHHLFPEEDVLVRNDGNGKFIDVANASGPYFREKYVGRGAAYGDLDNDGDLDLVVVNLGDRARILRNDGGNRHHWLKLDVLHANGKSRAIGARVHVQTGGLEQIQELSPVTGYLSQSDPRLSFGLGAAERADVEIRWPDGSRTEIGEVTANQTLRVIQNAK